MQPIATDTPQDMKCLVYTLYTFLATAFRTFAFRRCTLYLYFSLVVVGKLLNIVTQSAFLAMIYFHRSTISKEVTRYVAVKYSYNAACCLASYTFKGSQQCIACSVY